MSEKTLRQARIVSVVAATVISLSCGTNYVYSAWAPQFADRMKLSSTQSNLIGVFGNLGMYACGIPVGLLVDSKGPRPGVLLGSILLGTGYFSSHRAYDAGAGSVALPWLCLFSFMTGCGSAAAFSGSIKTSAINWPNHRGTATAFPLSAFGLSAFLFSTVSRAAFPANASHFLLMLAIGTFSMSFSGCFFLRIVRNPPEYSSLSSDNERPSQLHHRKSGDGKYNARRLSSEPGMQLNTPKDPSLRRNDASKDSSGCVATPEVPNDNADETSSLMSNASKLVFYDHEEDNDKANPPRHNPHTLDIGGSALLRKVDFWQLFSMLGLLTGIGLMTINNIGNDAQALWSHHDRKVTPEFIQKRQLMHVSVISVCSFVGRLLSGIGSDIIVKKLHMSRFWCLFVSSATFCVAQICGARIENPDLLVCVSGTTGLAYGFLFGVYPSLVAEAFGIHRLSQNWGSMTLAPVFAGFIFNHIYGAVYDAHSTVTSEGHRNCAEGLRCYSTAYWITLGAGLVGVAVSIWSIRHDSVIKSARRKLEREYGRV